MGVVLVVAGVARLAFGHRHGGVPVEVWFPVFPGAVALSLAFVTLRR